MRVRGWESYRRLWSTGEVIGVALLLADDGELTALGESGHSALERWAFDLWGLDRGQADVDNGFSATRRWFEGLAIEFSIGDATRTAQRPDPQMPAVRDE